MAQISPFESGLVSTVLAQRGAELAPGTAVFFMPDTMNFVNVFREAVSPALFDCGFSTRTGENAFDSSNWLSDVVRKVMGAEILIADLTGRNPDVLYVLGLCHGLSRCPLLITQDMDELPFNLDVFRRFNYVNDANGLFDLRENLGRAIRVFMAEAQASRQQGNKPDRDRN